MKKLICAGWPCPAEIELYRTMFVNAHAAGNNDDAARFLAYFHMEKDRLERVAELGLEGNYVVVPTQERIAELK